MVLGYPEALQFHLNLKISFSISASKVVHEEKTVWVVYSSLYLWCVSDLRDPKGRKRKTESTFWAGHRPGPSPARLVR